MTDDQREFLAGLVANWIRAGTESRDQARYWLRFTAEDVDRSPQWLGQLVRRGWLESSRRHDWRPRTYGLTRDGMIAVLVAR